MQIDELRRCLDQPVEAESLLRSWGLEDVRRAHSNLAGIAQSGVTLDLLADLCDQLAEVLPGLSDPDRALNNLERFVRAARNPLSLASLFERDREALAILLQIFASSQHLSDVLVLDNESYDLLRLTEGQPVERSTLVDELAAEIEGVAAEPAAMTTLRRYKRRETLRIAYGDLIRAQRLEVVTEQISYLADAIIEAAIRFARRWLEEKYGQPRRSDGHASRFVALGLGKLGGVELNYSSDVDLIFLYEADGKTDGPRSITNGEFFDRLVREVVRLLTEPTTLGYAYRVDLRLRPEGERGPVVHSLERAMRYYDVLGRTWERQAFVKARAVAGDLELGRRFLDYLEPWVYRRYLGLADISGIKALKRRIEQQAQRGGDDQRNVKTGHGGIRDIEFVIQFLQLLNGGDLAMLRTGNTLRAMAALEDCGCLTHQERQLLEEHYAFLRKIEHRLQIMFDLQTHVLPDDPAELERLAIRLGYARGPNRAALTAFEQDYATTTELNRKILDHLLHDAFGDDPQTEPEVDLVLDPDPPPDRIFEVLARHHFRDVSMAYKNLMHLATEKIRFLSTRRCRHFLAAIAPRLIRAIGETPDPDRTLVTLEQVSDSLGGKGVLWELFSFNPPTMHLYVELCASSPYLSSILITNPGMIDELMDSLVLNKLPSRDSLHDTLAELAHGAEDLEPILHSFKNTQQLRIGVRNILGKEDIGATMGALSDVAETCLERIALAEYAKLAAKLGEPTIGTGPRTGERAGMVILAMGKLGGRELNYHSDLDVIFLYEADGSTMPSRRGSRSSETTTNQHFFSELGTRIIKTCSRLGQFGRLYEIDTRLRPTGKSGTLATSFDEFQRYFAEGRGQLWERQALCKARAVFGEPELCRRAMRLVHQAAYEHLFHAPDAVAIRQMRMRIEAASTPNNLKRGIGGLCDIDFLVQMLQLRCGRECPQARQSSTLDALAALHKAGRLSTDDYEFLYISYRFLRTVELRLRLVSTTARDALPDDSMERARLARALGLPDGDALVEQYRRLTSDNRRRFDDLVAETAAGADPIPPPEPAVIEIATTELLSGEPAGE
ncbi:MAG TPA: bifunctional [glutamate--ammonia ligase]-adenylyl-L-tyrosine phosphorylase/[glutamate--ammonia-ligase] adenylyltransferase [Pirellulales bacterium]|jgi:glutamate-ammonia-ligase adenylyltransferase|nr:bifunctional [glutamate--ammonia ligase]-adenylyl-L-tyrosine phosphorylase/[glutamate--ammonia-ligase] adenylyltransferase [Pirellulales bacterium]